MLYARLTQRIPTVFEVARLTTPGVCDMRSAVAALEDAGLVDGLVTWRQRAEQLPKTALRSGARRCGLPTGGSKQALVERMAPHAGWHEGRWLRVRHRGLIRRLERWAQLRARPDRSTWVVARLGVVRWPDYELTRGSALWRTRSALIRWERLLDPELPVETALRAIDHGTGRAPGRLDLRGRLLRGVLEAAREHERDERGNEAVTLYERLHASGVPLPTVAFRWSRALEAAGQPRQALDVLAQGRTGATGVRAIEIARAGRRLARRLRQGWAPDRPARPVPERHVRMPLQAGPSGHRPRWRPGTEDELVEAATQSLLAAHGRRAIHGEGRLWRTVFALLFADVYFLPVPGALPVPYLSGPLDLGSPTFRAARATEITHVLEGVAQGEAASRIEAAYARWEGTQLAWARWDVTDGRSLAEIVEGIGPGALTVILEAFLSEGRGAARGMPDLVVLPGAAATLPDAVPSRVPPRLILVEVKGPNDSLRDAQAIWIERLLRAGVGVEVWNVRPAPNVVWSEQPAPALCDMPGPS